VHLNTRSPARLYPKREKEPFNRPEFVSKLFQERRSGTENFSK